MNQDDECVKDISMSSMDGVHSMTNVVGRVGDWMNQDDECVKDIDEISKLVVLDVKNCECSRVKLPVPRTDWSAYQTSHGCAASSSLPPFGGILVIPRLSREVLIEGIVPFPSLLPVDVKKQKIRRYLEKRQRRLNRKSTLTSKVAYGARRDLANKRTRVNGRFVSTSEFGQKRS